MTLINFYKLKCLCCGKKVGDTESFYIDIDRDNSIRRDKLDCKQAIHKSCIDFYLHHVPTARIQLIQYPRSGLKCGKCAHLLERGNILVEEESNIFHATCK